MWMGYFPHQRSEMIYPRSHSHSMVKHLCLTGAHPILFILSLFTWMVSPGKSPNPSTSRGCQQDWKLVLPGAPDLPTSLVSLSPSSFLPFITDHLPQVPQSYCLGLAMEEEPSRRLLAATRTERRMEEGEAQKWPPWRPVMATGAWVGRVALEPFLKPELTLFHLPDPRERKSPLLSAESRKTGGPRGLSRSTSFRESLQCI